MEHHEKSNSLYQHIPLYVFTPPRNREGVTQDKFFGPSG